MGSSRVQRPADGMGEPALWGATCEELKWGWGLHPGEGGNVVLSFAVTKSRKDVGDITG